VGRPFLPPSTGFDDLRSRPGDLSVPLSAVDQPRDPGVFVQLAVRETDRLIQRILANRFGLSGADEVDDDREDPTQISQSMTHTDHVSRNGVAFSLQMAQDAAEVFALRGLAAEISRGGIPGLFSTIDGLGLDRALFGSPSDAPGADANCATAGDTTSDAPRCVENSDATQPRRISQSDAPPRYSMGRLALQASSDDRQPNANGAKAESGGAPRFSDQVGAASGPSVGAIVRMADGAPRAKLRLPSSSRT